MARSENNLTAVLQDTADAIRAKKESSNDICPRDFADEIASIQTGITPTGALAISSNGQYDVTNYAQANVNVPNPSTGTLSITANGTYNVTDYASASVTVAATGILQYPDANSTIVSGATAKAKKDQVGQYFQWLYVASDWSPNAMNEVSMMVSNSAEDEYLVFKFGGNESQCYFEVWTSGTNDQGTNGIRIYKVYIPNGCYFKLPYWFNGGDSIKIVTVQSTGLWYNSKAFFVSAY